MYYTNETANKRQMEEAFYQNQQYPSMTGTRGRCQSSGDEGGIVISVNPVILVDCGERSSNSSADTTTTTNNNPSAAEVGTLVSGIASVLAAIFK